MSVVAPKLFQSVDAGAPTLSGTAGDLVELLSSCLVLRRAFSATSGASFVDRTTEARLQGGTAFAPFQTPGTSDEFYLGLTAKFERAAFLFGTLGVGGTVVWEFWNGSAWTSFSPTDGTSGFTANGAVTWAIASLTGWATSTVNSITAYWIRARLTVANSTNPLVNSVTLTGWSIAYSGTNQAAYQMGGGNQFFLNVNDNGPGAGGAREARVLGYETMTAVGTGTNPFPTAALCANGIFFRKSATLDATARAWVLMADDRTFYLAAIPGDTNSLYFCTGFGDFYSFTSSDPYRVMLLSRHTENVAATNTANFVTDASKSSQDYDGGTADKSFPAFYVTSTNGGKYLARNYAGAVGAVGCGLAAQRLTTPTDFKTSAGFRNKGDLTPWCGRIDFPNRADGGVFASPIWIYENGGAPPSSAFGVVPNFRGRLRGFLAWEHIYNAVPDKTVIAGSGAMAGKTLLVLQPTQPADGDGAPYSYNGALVFETSDTWETN